MKVFRLNSQRIGITAKALWHWFIVKKDGEWIISYSGKQHDDSFRYIECWHDALLGMEKRRLDCASRHNRLIALRHQRAITARMRFTPKDGDVW